ncbi:hypothetical protein [Chamaesiphon sp. OTE_75_metabat_556]|uniref:hypothetical protein n=1 Tax=Chamaesiphon sp. OTE_75_metabat_556 TaxID=2964692 RepID=UPI00286AD116|nr:hypothetical protein [Chamaesiphon sp. OTE_75_metabat_556]
MYVVEMHKCQNCGFPIEMRLFSVSSGIGPAEINCVKCGELVDTGRREWGEMSSSNKGRFYVVTLLYIFMLGLLTGNFIDQAYQLWNKDPVIVNLRYEAMPFQMFAVAGGVAAVLLQIYRIRDSTRRSRRTNNKLTMSEFMLGIQWNLQFKCLVFLIVIWTIATIKNSL